MIPHFVLLHDVTWGVVVPHDDVFTALPIGERDPRPGTWVEAYRKSDRCWKFVLVGELAYILDGAWVYRVQRQCPQCHKMHSDIRYRRDQPRRMCNFCFPWWRAEQYRIGAIEALLYFGLDGL